MTERERTPRARRCPICLEDLDNEPTIALECTHQFHGVCAALWFRRNPSCPVCRALPDSEPESAMDLDAELSTMPARVVSSLVSEPLGASRRRNADPALRRAALAFRRARDASRLASRAEREHRASEPFRSMMRELRSLVEADVNRRRAAAVRAADLLRTWETLPSPRRFSHP